MSNKRIAFFTICILMAIFLLTGYNWDAKKQLQNQNLESIREISIGEIEYVGRVSGSNEIYSGLDQYRDSKYTYFLHPIDSYVVTINNNDMIISEDYGITSDQAEKVASELFCFCNSNVSFDNITVIKRNGIEGVYEYEFVEKMNGVETGTKALILVANTGEIASATFLRKEELSQYSNDIPLTEAEAQSIAVNEIVESDSEIINIIVKDSNYDATVKTFKATTYWRIQMECVVQYRSGKNEDRYYEVSVNYYTGEVLEIAKNI